MEKTLLVLAAVTLLGSLFFLNNQTNTEFEGIPAHVAEQFQAYKTRFNKKYGTLEDTYRISVFFQNLQQIKEYNQYRGETIMGLTIFSDLTDQEFQDTYLTKLVPEVDTPVLATPSLEGLQIPDALDWTGIKTTPVKDQGQCGSCWAFSTTGVVESLYWANGSGPSLSEQQLVDCAGILYGNLGCNGGMPARALNYVAKNGLTTEDKYPYKAVKQTCGVTPGPYSVKGHTKLEASDNGLIFGLQNGPVSVAVDATNWKNYVSGVFTVNDCATSLNHAVLAVGYNAQAYRVKNSWTTQWGDNGFIWLQRANTCGVWNELVVAN